MVRITEITFLPMEPNQKGFLGLAGFVIDNKLKLSGISVYTTRAGYRLLYPVCHYPHGKVINSVYPIDRETGRIFTEAVSSKVKELGEKLGKGYNNTNCELYLDD